MGPPPYQACSAPHAAGGMTSKSLPCCRPARSLRVPCLCSSGAFAMGALRGAFAPSLATRSSQEVHQGPATRHQGVPSSPWPPGCAARYSTMLWKTTARSCEGRAGGTSRRTHATKRRSSQSRWREGCSRSHASHAGSGSSPPPSAARRAAREAAEPQGASQSASTPASSRSWSQDSGGRGEERWCAASAESIAAASSSLAERERSTSGPFGAAALKALSRLAACEVLSPRAQSSAKAQKSVTPHARRFLRHQRRKRSAARGSASAPSQVRRKASRSYSPLFAAPTSEK